ncbi:protein DETOXIFICATION 35 isoform X2 [Nymphaea colorata]|uniref:protein DETOXIFICATION 35 isoform X2 n=1 Tax=Nymphaea colorata TaxID=210225 RepID=UPI00129D4702|nr:protein DETOXIFICATION 35 isoform X2 [Nymphaea colorata]
MEEASPLLLNGASREVSGDNPEVENASMAWRLFLKESGRLWSIGIPIVFQLLCIYGINASTQILVGQVGELQLAAISIGLSVIGNFAFGFLLGMGSALETLCGQAYGAGQVHMLGVYMQRSWIILLVCCLIMSPIYVFAGPILKLIGQEEDIAQLAGSFTILIIPQLFSYAINFPVQKFLQAQSKVMVLAWIGLVALVLQVFLVWLFIWVFGWDLAGAAVALDISAWFIVVAQLVYVFGWCKDGWTGFSLMALNDIWAFVRLSLASAVMLCLEVWYMMILVLLTGYLNDAAIAVDALSICMNINGWEFIIFIGVNAAISVRISNELGSGHPRTAKFAVVTSIISSLLIGFFFMAVILIARDYFAVLFTSSKEVQRVVTKLAYILAVTMVLNSVQPVISGIAIGGGWQALVAYINLGCYYVFGLPLGIILGYKLDLGVQGIWSGLLAGTILQTLILIVILWRTDWKKEAAVSSKRVKTWGGQIEDELQVDT